MKVSGSKIQAVLQAETVEAAAVLVYGPDQGLVSRRAKIIAGKIVEDLSDPFSAVELSLSDLKEEPCRLADEARALSFGGGGRLIRFREATDSLAGYLGDYLTDPAEHALVLVSSGDLGPRSALRKLFENHERSLALPCYVAEGRELEDVVTSLFQQLGVCCDREALGILVGRLASDRGQIEQEINKLGLYAAQTGRITVADVEACMIDSALTSLEELCYAVADGNGRNADLFLQRALNDGVGEVGVLRALQRHFLKLEWVVSQASHHGDVSALVGSLRPPVFFKLKGRFERQASRWTAPGIRRGLQNLVEAEISCKTTGNPAALVCGRTVLALARPH